MNKKIFISLMILLTAINALLYAQSKSEFNSQQSVTITTSITEVASLSNDEHFWDDCIAGGKGAISCSLKADGEAAGTGGGLECEVTCGGSTYACCTLTGCHCREADSRE